jgi:hypothetical protein
MISQRQGFKLRGNLEVTAVIPIGMQISRTQAEHSVRIDGLELRIQAEHSVIPIGEVVLVLVVSNIYASKWGQIFFLHML